MSIFFTKTNIILMIPYPRWKRNKNRLEFYDKTILSKQISIVKTALFL